MDKFENELSNAKNQWIIRIGNYLKSRDDMKHNLAKENKSLDECFRYILNELSKQETRKNNVAYAAGDDEELYSLAVHYYDEDDIKVPKELNFITNANGTAFVKPQKKSSTVPKETKKEVPKAPKKKPKKENINKDQLSIFDL